MDFDFENLNVYQDALELAGDVILLMGELPTHVERTVGYQLSRAALSIPLNIAEGSAYSKKQFSHHLDIARGSVRECIPCLQVLKKYNYVKQEEFDAILKSLVDISKMLSGLKKSLSTTFKRRSSITKQGLRTPNPEPRTKNAGDRL